MDPRQRLIGTFVVLRPLTVSDAALTFGWRNGQRASLLNQGAQSVDAQTDWIASRSPAEFNYIIETKQGRPIGMLSLTAIDRHNGFGEPGRFLISDEVAARGIPAAVEAMLLLYRLAFDQLALRRVWGIVAAANTRMLKWQKYLGMTEEGRLRSHLVIDGQVQDAVIFGLLEAEYRRKTEPLLQALVAAGHQVVATSTSQD